ncbi:hypothetical protein BOX15_Mlig009444g1 [Macrostomum lignano]|uniref:Uncharacterized protein n=1 Tax=Macrostomum lignano TaxID=282301 RepID=A0A267GHN6_9PLAT|nr:hypothetical protein BOX15_Mlig009444g1 [Macrostomum lignano]
MRGKTKRKSCSAAMHGITELSGLQSDLREADLDLFRSEQWLHFSCLNEEQTNTRPFSWPDAMVQQARGIDMQLMIDMEFSNNDRLQSSAAFLAQNSLPMHRCRSDGETRHPTAERHSSDSRDGLLRQQRRTPQTAKTDSSDSKDGLLGQQRRTPRTAKTDSSDSKDGLLRQQRRTPRTAKTDSSDSKDGLLRQQRRTPRTAKTGTPRTRPLVAVVANLKRDEPAT